MLASVIRAGARDTSGTLAARIAFGILATLPLTGPASAVEWPRLKPGLWESRISHSAMHPRAMMTARMCIDAATQRALIQEGEAMADAECPRRSTRAEGNRYVTDAECRMQGSRITSRIVVTFTGDAAYRGEIDATYEPPLNGQRTSKTRVDGRHVGSCPAGMKPGDISMPGLPMLSTMPGSPSGGMPPDTARK